MIKMARKKNHRENEEKDIEVIRAKLGGESREKEAIVKQTIGKDNFLALQVFAFEYACRVAEEIGFPYSIINPESREYNSGAKYQFLQMCQQHRRYVIAEVYDSLRSSKERIDSSRTITLPSQEDMTEMIRREIEEGKKIEFIVHDYTLCYISRPSSKGSDLS